MVLWYFTLNTLRISLQKEILKDGAMFSFRTQRRLTTACYKTGSSLSNSMVDVVIKGDICGDGTVWYLYCGEYRNLYR